MAPAGVRVQVLYFAWMREAIGMAGESVPVPGPAATVAGLVAALRARGGGYETAFARPELVRAAVNQAFVPLGAPVAPGDEVAFFPPVTGG